MKKYKIFLSIILLSVICSIPIFATKGDNILGYWERVGDDKSGLIIKIVEVCDENMFIGIVAKAPNALKELYNVKDVYWQNIKFIKENQWEGTILIRGLKSGWSSRDYVFDRLESKYVLVNENMLEAYTKDGTQKWLKKTKKEIKGIKGIFR